MSAICQRLESAILKSLLRSSTDETGVSNSLSVATEATGVTVTPNGAHVVGDFGEFTLNFYTGLSQDDQVLPAITIQCVESSADESAPQIKTCEAQVALRYPADDSSENASISAALLGVGSWLDDEMSGGFRIRERIEFADSEIVVSFVRPQSGARGVDGEKRTRWIAYSLSIVAALSN